MFLAFIALVALMHRLNALPQTVLFWAAYILTRPLGATLGDTLTKPHAQGGFAAGQITASFALAAVMAVLIAATPSLQTKGA